MAIGCVFLELKTGYLNIIKTSFGLKGLKTVCHVLSGSLATTAQYVLRFRKKDKASRQSTAENVLNKQSQTLCEE
jgi:hypothetical protein